jgi:Tol biopolymer transport system component
MREWEHMRHGATIRLMLVLCVMSGLAALPPAAQATFPGKNGKIAFDALPGVATMNPDGTAQMLLRAGGSEPAWSPDGSKIAFASGSPQTGTGISVMNADGSGVLVLTAGQLDDGQPSWSPDGRWIAFERYDPATYYQLYLIRANGTGLTRLRPTGIDWAQDPTWSPDGSRIAFTAPTKYPGYIEDLPDIYSMRPDGTDVRRLTNDPDYDAEPSWSPDGSRLAFVSLRNPGHTAYWRIYTISADGSGVKKLTALDVNEFLPAWSPDGTKIAFYTYEPSTLSSNVYVMNSDGSGRTKLTAGTYNTDPDWQPLGLNRADYKTAQDFCRAEQAFLGSGFSGRYRNFGACVSAR